MERTGQTAQTTRRKEREIDLVCNLEAVEARLEMGEEPARQYN